MSQVPYVFKEALERLALPLAFGLPGRATPEDQARMVYAQSVLDGDTLPEAERKATARAHEARDELIQRSLRE